MLVYSLGYTYGKVLGSDEGIKLGLFDDKVLGNILVNVDGITLRLDIGVETSRDSYIGRNPLPKLRTHKPTRTTRVLQTVVA